jgi:hypothetical protein
MVFQLLPKCGIRRNTRKSFNYELGLGIGHLHFINQLNFTLADSDGIIIDAHLRIGHTFW